MVSLWPCDCHHTITNAKPIVVKTVDHGDLHMHTHIQKLKYIKNEKKHTVIINPYPAWNKSNLPLPPVYSQAQTHLHIICAVWPGTTLLAEHVLI